MSAAALLYSKQSCPLIVLDAVIHPCPLSPSCVLAIPRGYSNRVLDLITHMDKSS